MFTLTVLSRDPDLLAYLQQESTETGDAQFGFTTPSKAASVVAPYVLYHMLTQKMNEFVSQGYLREEHRKSYAELYASYEVSSFVPKIETILSIQFSYRETFHLFGFISFSVKDVQKELYTILYACLNEFYRQPKQEDPYDWVSAYYRNQRDGPTKLNLVVSEDGSLALMSESDTLYKSSYHQQHAVIGHVIDEKPQSLTVYDPLGLLQQELAIVLKRLFRKKVRFTDDKHPFATHP